MKNLIINIFLLIPLIGLAQINTTNPPTQIVEICSGVSTNDAPEYTYFKDINNTFDKYIGTWKYESGDDIVIFEIVKVTQKYDAEFKIFRDYLIGNYSYSNDGGVTFVVNSIPDITSEEPEDNTMLSICQDNDTKMSYRFTELIYNKLNSSCTAIFEFVSGSLTEMQVNITNKDCVGGSLGDEEPFNFNFSIPTSMVVVKQ